MNTWAELNGTWLWTAAFWGKDPAQGGIIHRRMDAEKKKKEKEKEIS